MVPTLESGDALAVWWFRAHRTYGLRAGRLVVARPLERPELLVVKRLVRPLGGRVWEVAADNPAVAGLGWTGGPADVLGRVLLRYWPVPLSLLR